MDWRKRGVSIIMLNQRQLETLLELFEKPEQFMTAAFFAEKQQVSVRTAQSDLRAIKTELEQYPCVSFQAVTAKGSRVVIQDASAFAALKEGFYQQFGNTTLNYQSERISQILILLLRQYRAVSYYDLENAVFVSHSTLMNDLKLVDDVLRKYQLSLMHSGNKIIIDGSEINKRLCISEENLLFAPAPTLPGQDGDLAMKRIKDLLVETFVSFRHTISEVDLNNLIVFLYVSLLRMRESFFIAREDIDAEDESLGREREMSAAIYQRFDSQFHVQSPEAEIVYLALYLKGRGNLPSSSVISQDVDDLVLDGLREIRSAFHIDLTNDVNLRIALALHCTQLMVRIRYEMQMKNHIVDYIRQNYPQGFDLATYFASFLQKRVGKPIRNEEIAFIAIHMYKGLSDLQSSLGTRKVLVISSLHRSENTLIRQTLYKWFADQISELLFLPPSEMNETYLEKYDTFLTTEKGRYYDMGLAFYISPFPGRQDYLNIKLALDGFESIEDILQIFHQDLFEIFRKDAGRDEILRILCAKSEKFFQLSGLHEAVLEREKLGSSFFGNTIAAPHPILAVSSDTFISVGILPQSVEWDQEGNRVSLVLLVSVGKNNPKAFQIWNYLSKIFADRTFTQRLLANPGYETFLRLLKDVIAEDFKR